VTGKETIERRRQPHAVLDLASRRLKAVKIERLLDLSARQQPMRMLEIGTGSGGIAHYFATHPDMRIEVDAVDVVDSRLIQENYRFELVSGTALPFPDQSFDVVLTNHVIEHVGDQSAQLAHLHEIRRVLRSEGVGYLAVPNRWRLVEPHYRLALLSWWPRRWRSMYLRMLRKAEFYDCEPLSSKQVEHLLRQSGFAYEGLGARALRETVELEYLPRSSVRRLFDRMPDFCITVFAPLMPTLIYRFCSTPVATPDIPSGSR